MTVETYLICSGPFDERLAVIGDTGFSGQNLRECIAFKKQLARAFGEPLSGAELIIKSELSRDGLLWNVAVQFDSDPEAVAYADRIENGVAHWDQIAMVEMGLGTTGAQNNQTEGT